MQQQEPIPPAKLKQKTKPHILGSAIVSKVQALMQRNRKPLIIVAVIAAVAVVFALIFLGYRFSGTGFQKKTLWDWLQLLIIPVVLAVGGYWLNQIQKSREEKTTERRAKIEREAAEKRAQAEREIAQDNQHETALQEYIDKMSELLLDRKLRESQPEDEARKIALVRTLTVLPRLDGKRKGSVLQFLYESGLLDKDKSIVDLHGANLLYTELYETNLSNADLSGADLCGATLEKVNLENANLNGAYLSDANLSNANLRGASLKETKLAGTCLSGANLSNADLSGAHLNGADLSREIETFELSGGKMSNVTYGRVTDLSGTNLSNADLSDADLSGANLREANLQKAKYNTKAVQEEDVDGEPIIIEPTQWPRGFNPKAAGAICVDC